MATRMQQRRGTAGQWTSANPILNEGEIGFEIDTNQFKIGDGTNHWADLSYFIDETSLNTSLDGYVETSLLGVANGVATLNSSGKLESSQVPNIDELAQDAVDAALTAGTGITKSYNDNANTITVAIDSTVTTNTGSQTLTNKTFDLANNTVSGTVAQFNSALSDANFITTTDTGTVTSTMLADETIVNADIANTAAISQSKIADLTTDLAAKANLSGATFTGNVVVQQNLQIDGNFTVNGSNVLVSATQIQIEDSILQLAHENSANTVDLGFVAGYNDGTAKHAGLVKDATDGKWKLFKGVTTEPSTTVDFTQATLDDLVVGSLDATSLTLGNVTSTEFGYLDGVTSGIQSQIDGKISASSADTLTNKTLANVVITGTVNAGGTAGDNGQYLQSTGTGVQWANVAAPSAATNAVAGTVLGYTSSANGNIGLGFSALGSQSASNDEHVAIGYEALSSVGSSAFGDVMIGYRSGYGITTSEYNIGIGGFNFWGATTGSYNTAIGYEALPAYKAGGLTGSNNTFIGYRAGYDSRAGINDSVALGNYALYALNAAYSTAVGATALQNSSTGGSNTALGFEAGTKVTTGANNTIIGTSAGGGYVYSTATDLTTGSNNILIGYRAAASSSTVSNEITFGDSSITRFRIPGLEIDWQTALMEKITTSATAATGTINYDLITNKSILYYTSNASGNWTLNVRGNSGTTLNNLMSIGQSLTIAFLVTNGSTAYRQTGFQIDGNAVTPKWQGGAAPSSGNVNSIDVYSITIIKTANATFTALESQTKFA